MAKPTDRKVTTRELMTQLPRALGLVWQASRAGSLGLGALTLVQAALPASMAWVGKLIIDAVVHGSATPGEASRALVWRYVWLELGLALVALLVGRLAAFNREVLRVRLGNRINEQLLEKSLTLELKHFEDSNTYDIMQNARREAATRPLALAMDAVLVVKNVLMLTSFAALLWSVSWWSVLVLVAAAVPAFIAETKLSTDAFRLYSWRAPEGRRLNYLEWILTRDSHVKEVKLFGLGPLILGRYRALFAKFLGEDRRLARKRLMLGAALGALSLAAFYACYLAVAARAAEGTISVGDLTLYLAVFRQGQAALEASLGAVAGMYEDALFLSNLTFFLELPAEGRTKPPHACQRPCLGARMAHRARPRVVHATPAGPSRRCDDISADPRAGREAGAGRRERRRQVDPHQAAAAAVRAHVRVQHSVRRRRPARPGRGRAAQRESALSFRTSCATSSPPPRTSAWV
jgi:ATP-binding cassette subfamily B protein